MPTPIKDLINQRFGRLVVMSIASKKDGNIQWTCHCDCGKTVVVRRGDLTSENTQSCGCLWIERLKSGHTGIGERSITHGYSKRYGNKTPTYRSWQSMIQRVCNPNSPKYALYGGAGVKCCTLWRTFEGFLKSLGTRPEGTTLGRILDIGDYEPSNAFWMTSAEQSLAARNKHSLLKLLA